MAKLSISQKKCWQELLDSIRQIEKLSAERVCPSPKNIESRLRIVFGEDYRNQNFTILHQKVNALYRNGTKKYPEIHSDEQFRKLRDEHIEDYLLADNHTIKANFIGKTQNPHPRFMDLMAIAYGEAINFEEYYERKNAPPVRFEGRWVSVVRSNDRQHLLLAPILVSKEENTYRAVMRSKYNTFEGKVYELNGCLQLLFDNGEKMLLLSFRIGAVKVPKLLQGTFSGIASNGAPIAGVEWLVRPDELPADLDIPAKLQITNGTADWKGLPEKLQNVFKDFDNCYFKTNIDRISSCSWTDLDV
ncbi:MAG: hypothetical protein EAZ08_05725 [Cytophagales bacterium]|nr:MAG: hypothetical protein EAZ08_05725 [Cytophagales bacterium]